MTHLDDPDLERLGDALRASTIIDLAREERATRPERRTRPRRRVLAGGTLGLAGVGAALVLALSAGGAAAPPAFAITTSGDGSVLVNVKFYSAETIPAVNRKLAAMGIDEQVLTTWQGSGPAPVSAPVNCTPWHGVTNLPGPPVKVLLASDGTQVVHPGQSADNTGVGTYHITNCFLIKTGDTVSGNSGNSGAG
jgi:hypothetical protein